MKVTKITIQNPCLTKLLEQNLGQYTCGLGPLTHHWYITEVVSTKLPELNRINPIDYNEIFEATPHSAPPYKSS